MKKIYSVLMAIIAIGVCGAPSFVNAGTDPTSTMTPAAAALIPPPVTLHLRITAYSSTPDQTDSTPFITANGTYVHDGIVATNLLPFGTKIQIPSLFGSKIFTVEDRMNVRYPTSLDIWMATTSKALYFGVHTADVVILNDNNISIAKN